MLFIPIFANAKGLNFIMENEVTEEQEVNGSSVILGNNITSKNKVSGIDILLGNNVTFEGDSQYGVFLGNNINVKGNIANDGFIFGNVVKLDSDVVVNRDLIIFGSEVIVDGKINRDITIYASNVEVNGEISGNVKIIAEQITVKGNISGILSYKEDAVIDISGTVNETEVIAVEKVSIQDKIWQFIVNYGGTLVIFVAIALVMPQIFKKIQKENKNITILNWFSLFGFGTLSIILVPFIFLLLLNLIFGFSLAILLLIIYVVAIWLSHIFTSYLIGYLIWKNLIKKEENIYLIGLIGISIVSLMTAIPNFGILISVVCVMIGMGLILQQFKKDN